jgi:hypothetical protein
MVKNKPRKGEQIMAINDISLTTGMRSNLLSLQGTVELLNRTQDRLATGKKVNTAMDNPVSFFAAQALNSRASIIDGLKDAMVQAVQTITSADKGISAISTMIEQAKGIAQSAQSAAAGSTSTVNIASPTAYTPGTASIDLSTMQSFVAGTVSIDVSGMTQNIGTVDIDISAMQSFAAGDVNIDLSAMTQNVYANVTLTLGTLAADETFTIGGQAFTLTDVAAAGNFETLAELADEINATLSDQGISATLSGGTELVIALTSGAFETTAIGGADAGNLGLTQNAEIAGDTITFGGATYTAGIDFTNAASLVTILSDTGGYTASEATGDVVTAKTAGTTVLASEFTEVGSIAITTGNAEIAGDTITFGGATYTAGVEITNAASLVAALSTAGYTASSATGDVVTAATAGTNVLASAFSEVGSIAITTGTPEVAGDTITFGGATYTAGIDFTNGASLVTILSNTGGYTASSADGDMVTVATAGTTVETSEFSEVGGAVITTATAAVAGDTITFGGATYTAGVEITNAASLVAALSTAGYTASEANGNVVTAAKTGATATANVLASEFTEVGAIAITTGTEQAMSFTIGSTTFASGTDFAIGATNTDTAVNLAAAMVAANFGNATANGESVSVIVPSSELASLESQYNTVLAQLSALAEDSGYKGKNLLSADEMVVKFEGANLTVSGFDASATGLALSNAAWVQGGGGNIDADISSLDKALVTLREQSSQMSGNLSIITVRQSFSTNMINTLNAGADKLTLADTNEEGANMLMLQTRQSLAISALSMSANAAQSVLKLFG